MNTDYRIPVTYYSDPKTFAMKNRLGNAGLAALNFLWCWTAIHRADGILTDMNEEWIEGVSFWDGKHGEFLPALLDIGYLDQLENGTYVIHDWAETNSWAAEAVIREDKARFSNMARFYPELYEELFAQGVTGISKKDFARLTAEYNRRGILDTSSASNKKCDAYAPAPTPSPSPTPSPVPVPSTTPTPNLSRTTEPESVPEKTPKKIRRAVAKAPASLLSSSSSREKSATEILSQNPQAESTARTESATKAEYTAQAETKDSIKSEKILVQDEKPSTQETTPVENTDVSEATQAESATQAEPELSAEQYISEDAIEATLTDVLTQWNIQLARLGFPQVLRSTARRESAFKARIHASQERIYLAWWVALFDKIAASDFMRESARQKANWLTLDWVLKEQNMMKILEGKYDSERPVTAEIHRKTFRTKRVEETAQRTEITQDTPIQEAPAGDIPEESLRKINEIRQLLGKQPINNCIMTAEFTDSDAVMGAEHVNTLPEEIECDMPCDVSANDDIPADIHCDVFANDRPEEMQNDANPEDLLSNEELKEYYASCMEELEEYKWSKEEYEASTKGDDDYYVV